MGPFDLNGDGKTDFFEFMIGTGMITEVMEDEERRSAPDIPNDDDDDSSDYL